MPTDDIDALVRNAAFRWLDGLTDSHPDFLPHAVLKKGFDFKGVRVHVIGQTGIFKPAILQDVPLSITTVPGRYNDAISEEGGVIHYSYRDHGGPDHRDNAGLRLAMARRAPLIYFFAESPGQYLARYPAFIVRDDRSAHSFDVQFDQLAIAEDVENRRVADEDAVELRREYITQAVKRRLHQQAFRERVLRAYQNQCALCRLKHRLLLDAAHIIPDYEDGPPEVRNGLALCKIHHAAYDANILGIRPDYSVEVRKDVLLETDGPMLQHGLKAMHDQLIVVPRNQSNKPDRQYLERRFEKFRAQSEK